MITGVAPRYQAHRNFSGAPLRRSAAWRASQTAHRRALEELRRRDLCPKATSGLVGAGRTGRRVWAGQHACGACAMARPLPHVTRRYGRVRSKVKLWITTSVTRQIPAAGPRATAPGTVTWTYASRPSPETSRAAELEFFRDEHGGWRRYEPWMTTLVDADTGRVLGVVAGRDSAGVGTWLAARSPAWRDAVQVVAIDPSAAFRKALREQLPHAAVSVDPFHLVKLANDMLTHVRQRVVRDRKGRRGRGADPAWTNRRLLLRAGNTLSPRALARLKSTLQADDPTDEIGAAWGVKEQLRRLLTSGSLADAGKHKMLLGLYVLSADMPETDRLWATITAWWDAIEVLIVTGVTNARTEAVNTGIKQIKRTGRGYRNAGNYRARILLASAARTAA